MTRTHKHLCKLLLTTLWVTLCSSQGCLKRVWPPNSIRLGFICPREGMYGWTTSAAAFSMAVEKAQRDGFLSDKNITIHWHNGACDGRIALGGTVNLREGYDIDAMVGLPCSEASVNAGKLLSYWDLPFFAYSSPDPALANKNIYYTLVRLVAPFNTLALAVSDLFKYYHWKRAVMLIGPESPDDFCDYASRSLDEIFEKENITISKKIKIPSNYPVDNIPGYLKTVKETGRIVIICVVEYYLRLIMLEAHNLAMTSGDYVFITTNLLPATDAARRWYNASANNNDIARLAYQPLIQVAQGLSSGNEVEEFRNLIPYKMMEPPWNSNDTLARGLIGSVFSLYLHDCVYLYMMVADEALKLGVSIRNGSFLFQLAKQKTFQGITGRVTLDSNADRISDFWVLHLEQNGAKYVQYAVIDVTSPKGKRINFTSVRFWGPTEYDPPLDQPKCGFYNEKCPHDTGGQGVTITVASIIIIVLAIGIAAGIFIYRRRKFELSLELMAWKVLYADLNFIGRGKDDSGSTRSIGNLSKFSSSYSKSVGTLGSNTSEELVMRESGFAEIANYKGILVLVKNASKAGVLLTRHDYMELKAMKEMNHENVNQFVGMCLDAPTICFLEKYCPKGSLQDVLENVNIKLDTMFKSSLINDLIAGMEYIHRSPIKVHGRLKSSNCVIDGRWMLKITDYGVLHLRNHPDSEDARWISLLWTAPELLRDPIMQPNTKCDVFSFAIILQEIIYRTPPYEANGDLPMVKKDLIGRIRNGETPPFRPELPPMSGSETVNSRLLTMISECWAEDASSRPEFSTIKSKFSSINKGKKFNIMDNMIRMLEKYANNLEEVVNERTRQLTEEKKKTDRLLYRMLPSTVADALKTGQTVAPEVFASASIYFSDICSFTEMSSSSAPIEIVDFLNDLWTVFDDIIAKYNVYKVETIGDAYMVVSGVPIRCETHACEISDMSLDIMASVLTFKIRHRPEKQLRIRIGLHSGSVAAGVVGLTMPRYCLFGDTVNMASRMESTGKPLHIQISQSTASSLQKRGGYDIVERGQVEVKGLQQPQINMPTGNHLLVSIVVIVLLCTCAVGQRLHDNIDRGGTCMKYGGNINKPFHIIADVSIWQCIVILLCFGAFTIFVALIHRLVRTFVYYDAHLLDTFFDGGGDMNLGLIACGVVAKWIWTSTYTVSTADVARYGLVGSFWYAASTVVQICLFAIVSAEVRIKAPGAKTFLQVIKVRHGTEAHLLLTIFALIVNILVVGMVMMEGTRILASVTNNLNKEVITMILCVVVCVYTVVGGVGGSIYVAYFSCVLIFAIVLVIMLDVFWNTLDRQDNPYGNLTLIWDRLQCVIIDKEASNEGMSPVTFISRNGLQEAVVLLFSAFSMVFVDQSFWQMGVAAKPTHGVWGFLTGALAYFALPLAISYALGLAYWVLLVDYDAKTYSHVIPEEAFLNGTIFIIAAQRVMGHMGSFLVFVLTMVAVVTTCSSQVLSASSIVIYDMYQTYISPFKETAVIERSVNVRAAKAIRNEEYLEYDRRCVVLKHVVVVAGSMLPLAISMILLTIKIDHWWLFNFTGIMANCCVIPTALAITWHRVKGVGVVAGVLAGFLAGWTAWLVHSGVHHKGLEPFREATGGTGAAVEAAPFITGLVIALGVSGAVCIVTSLVFGGCDSSLQEEQEWEKTRQIDNPIIPWSVKYAPEVGSQNISQVSGRPHFYTVRRTFKLSEIIAYVLGVLFAVIIMLVWPALMLTQQIFTRQAFNNWTIMVVVWLVIGLAYLATVPLIWELYNVIRQAYYNSKWVKYDDQAQLNDELDQQNSPTPGIRLGQGPISPSGETRPNYTHTEDRLSDIDVNEVSGGNRNAHASTNDDAAEAERFRTFIELE